MEHPTSYRRDRRKATAGADRVFALLVGSGGGLTAIGTYPAGSEPVGIAVGTPPVSSPAG